MNKFLIHSESWARSSGWKPLIWIRSSFGQLSETIFWFSSWFDPEGPFEKGLEQWLVSGEQFFRTDDQALVKSPVV
jgi:hypothetical protein